MKVWNFCVAFVWINPTELSKEFTCTQFGHFGNQTLPLSNDLQGIFFRIGVFFEELTKFFGAFL